MVQNADPAGRAELLDWLDGGASPDRSTLRAAVQDSLAVLARAAPGHSVEVRIPPFGAVQCITGPRHGRGTPPNVVETDPHTWLQLATGRLSWDDALHSGKLSASGSRTGEIARLLPLA